MKTRPLISRKGALSRRLDAIGFTLIELMVTIAVMAILLGIAVPSFNEAMLGSKLRSIANEFAMSARLARAEAIKRNGDVTLCVSSDGAGCGSGDWSAGWIIFQDADEDGVIDSSEDREKLIHRRDAVPTGLAITEAGGKTRIIFKRTSFGGDSANIEVTRVSPPSSEKHRVCISRTGSTVVKKPNAVDSCPPPT